MLVRAATLSLSLSLFLFARPLSSHSPPRHHSADPPEVDEKFSELLSPGVIAPRADDESKIPRCKCDRSSSGCRPSTGFRLFTRVPVFLQIYRPLFALNCCAHFVERETTFFFTIYGLLLNRGCIITLQIINDLLTHMEIERFILCPELCFFLAKQIDSAV